MYRFHGVKIPRFLTEAVGALVVMCFCLLDQQEAVCIFGGDFW